MRVFITPGLDGDLFPSVSDPTVSWFVLSLLKESCSVSQSNHRRLPLKSPVLDSVWTCPDLQSEEQTDRQTDRTVSVSYDV